jgi:hypothetical protein
MLVDGPAHAPMTVCETAEPVVDGARIQGPAELRRFAIQATCQRQ